MRTNSILLLCFVVSTASAFGERLKGRVTDADGNGLPAVSVITNVPNVRTMTDDSGYYSLELETGPAGGSVSWITFSSIGYQTRQFRPSAVPDRIVLDERYYRGTEILVRAERAQAGVSPVSFTNYSRDEIERDYDVGEFPLLLATTPNTFTYTDGGAALGYAYMSIRGFDDKRITTYINGVPLNDPEWQQTYFVDLPDFAANVDDIQVQRGIGNSLYGDASFGGTINVVTNTLSRRRQAVVTSGFGEYTSGGESVSDISRQSVEYSSGLIDGRWHFTGRFSKQLTGGYREHSWYDGWSYYLSLARIDPNMTTELYVYGGPIRMHLAFWGASREAITADRRFNPRTYDNETDNFNQPHYHLHNTARLSDRITLDNTVYYIRGKGHYEQLAENSVFADYGIPPSVITIDTATGLPFESGNLVRQDHVKKSQYGWNPRLDITYDRGRHSIGGSVYFFESNHLGRVTWAQHVDGELDPQYQFYQWYGEQWVGSAYAEELYHLTDRLSVRAAAQLRYQRFNFDERAVGAFLGHQFSMDWLFFSPRLGFSYKLSPSVDVFTNLALASRPPIVATIYDGTNPNILPLLEVEDVNSDSTQYTFGDPLVDAERVYDIELGGSYRDRRLALKAGLFWMDFRDEILPYGPVNPYTGLRSAVNADRTVHAGVELDAVVKPHHILTLQGNFSYNYNRVKDFNIVLDGFPVDFSDKEIAGFPDYVANLVAELQFGNWRITNYANIAGRRYMELSNVESLSLDPYIVASFSVAYTFHNVLSLGNLTVEGRVENWADKKYETYGYGGNYAYDDGSGNAVVDGWAEYYVAPERWFYGQVRLETF
jgi:iron complex outermembrane receptor protein